MAGGGGGGGGGQPTYTPAPRQEIEPVPQAEFPTSGYGGVGYTAVPQTYTREGMPSWMQGQQMSLGAQGYGGMSGASKGAPNWFQMPQWGTDAATGQALTQEQLQPTPYEPPPQPVPQQAPQQTQPAPQAPQILGYVGADGAMYPTRGAARQSISQARDLADTGDGVSQIKYNMQRVKPVYAPGQSPGEQIKRLLGR